MSDFADCIPVVLAHEGGLVNDVADPGGATNFGISLYWLKHCGDLNHEFQLAADINHDGRIDIDDIKALTKETASAFYRSQWWDHYGYGAIKNRDVATKIFDMAVNMGGVQAAKLVQRALLACGVQCDADGILGAKSFEALNAVSVSGFLSSFKRLCASFYRTLVNNKPTLAKFLAGWLRRCAA